jgi:tRNA(fMet)-specific endonuclease VapC
MYLLDTNIVIFMFKNHEKVSHKMRSIGLENCYISEVSIAELKYGAAKSNRAAYHNEMVANFISDIQVIPIIDVLDVYATEKARLERLGTRIDDFDLLIGASAIENDLILVTNNISHLGRMADIQIEDWTQ